MIVYCKYNSKRKRAFQLITTVESRGENLVVSKQAATPEAEPFLQSLLEKYEMLYHPDFPLKLIRPYRAEKGKLSFDYVTYDSFDLLLQQAVKTGSRDKFMECLNRYKTLIFSIPQIEILPGENFNSIFPDVLQEAVPCTRYGCLDLNPDNIFIQKDNALLIDYEWTFNFPIPTNYIVFRGVTAFYGNHPSLRPAALIPLSKALEELGIPQKEQETYMQLEESFQIYVYGGDPALITNLEYLTKKYQHIENPEPSIPYTQKLLALNTYTVLLEKENNRKNSWIVRLEEAIKEKDLWIRKIEDDHAELSKSTVDLSRLVSSINHYKALSPNSSVIDSDELSRLQEYIKEIEKELERSNAKALSVEGMLADKNKWVETLESNLRELKNNLRDLRSQVALLSPSLLE